MRRFVVALTIAFISVIAATAAMAQSGPPPWAYGFTSANGPLPKAGSQSLPKDDGTPKHLPGSKFAFTLAQIWDQFAPADWYPEDHAPMPEIVAHGRKPDVHACGFCHYPNGKGRSENAASRVSLTPISCRRSTISGVAQGILRTREGSTRIS